MDTATLDAWNRGAYAKCLADARTTREAMADNDPRRAVHVRRRLVGLPAGPADANIALMIWMQKTPLRCIDGTVWFAEDWARVDEDWISETKRRVIVRDESAWFALWGMGCMPAPYRTPRMYQHAAFTPDAMVLGPAPVRQQSLFE